MDAKIEKILGQIKTLDQCSEEYKQACIDLNNAMTSAQRETLYQLIYNGPVWDGDILSKTARDDLFKLGLAGRAHVKGEQGYSVANYLGCAVLMAVNRIDNDKWSETSVREFKAKYPEVCKDIMNWMDNISSRGSIISKLKSQCNMSEKEAADLYRALAIACFV